MSRHRFIIVVPVADRPRHIQACLDSLHELLRRHPYGRAITVLIADDSADPDQVAANREIAARHSRDGVAAIHFGPDEQWALSEGLRATLPGVVGATPRDRCGIFGHKGQGVMRNIAYLKAAQMVAEDDDTLIWSLDSDQEFCVKLADGRIDYAVDYFGSLDAIFSATSALMLTGKVVGDPPVSPAVMTANFLADVVAFLEQMAKTAAEAPCGQHGGAAGAGDAAYHDMADLFGFKPAASYAYPCPLAGSHTEADCFAHFAGRVNSFFYGEHPTRVSTYAPAELFSTVQPARTVYAGNYVFRPPALEYFIPFAAQRLRMSGPTLGRLVRAELGPRFVSANLPMLHKRTVESGGQSEFRPGIETQERTIDMSGEFERQFYGDVMLFSIEKLTAGGPLDDTVAAECGPILEATRDEMLERYNARQTLILDQLARLEALLADPAHWWNRSSRHAAAVAGFGAFAANVRGNFGRESIGYRRINSAEGWRDWRGRLVNAVTRYPEERRAWKSALAGRR